MDRILIIDDDLELSRLVERFLTREGLSSESVHDGERGLERALSGEHLMVVLDVMLPKLNGFDVLRSIREKSKIPVLMLTARGEELDRIIGLEIGADDYLPKPFNPRELVARIRAIMRRIHPNVENEKPSGQQVVSIGDLELDNGTRTVRQSGALVDLTSAEFDILQILIQNAGHIVKREELAEAALGRKLSPYDRSIDNLVSKVRKKLGRHIGEIERIKPVRNTGYMYALVHSKNDEKS